MAQVIEMIKVMPTSPEVDLQQLATAISEKITAFGADLGKTEEEPVAFGLKALKLTFIFDESKGTTDDLEEDIQTIEGVQSVAVVDVRRAIG